jgi:hypothetical protein
MTDFWLLSGPHVRSPCWVPARLSSLLVTQQWSRTIIRSVETVFLDPALLVATMWSAALLQVWTMSAARWWTATFYVHSHQQVSSY